MAKTMIIWYTTNFNNTLLNKMHLKIISGKTKKVPMKYEQSIISPLVFKPYNSQM